MAEPVDPFLDADWLPDLQRAPDPWRQLRRDLVAPAPVSDWASRVTTVRVRAYDQIRPYVTRGILLLILALLLVMAPGTWWLTWVTLLPGLIQVVSETAVGLEIRRPEASGVAGILAGVTERAHSYTLINITGVIGALAVPANIVAAAYLTGPGEPTWTKVLALAAAAAFGVSAILSFLTDATHYSSHQPNTKPYRLFRRMRPHLWLMACATMAMLVGGSVIAGRWAPSMEPLAWSLCAVPALIGMKQRDYERFLRASSEMLPEVQLSAKRSLCKDYHNVNNSIRTFNRRVALNKDVPPAIRVEAAALAPLISMMPEAVDQMEWADQGSRPSLAGLAAKCASDGSFHAVVDLRLDDLEATNYGLARQLITALLINVGQAMLADSAPTQPRGDRTVHVAGQVHDGEVRITVRDPLPVINDWCREGSTMLWLHSELIAHGGAGLSQHPVDPGDPGAGKEIRARWPVKRPPLRLRDGGDDRAR